MYGFGGFCYDMCVCAFLVDKKTEMVYSNASKQFLVFVPPAVLTLHLKRFEQVMFGLND